MGSENEAGISELDRMSAFLRLVTLQDEDLDVAASRARVAQEFGLTLEQVVSIEREGMERDWPPLD